jgi:hypothetical protein
MQGLGRRHWLALPGTADHARAEVPLVRLLRQIATGQSKLVIRLSDIARTPPLKGDLSQAKHWFKHQHIQEPSKECRCDLHPRFSRDGRTVVIDAPHAGGRQLHLLDVSAIVG